LKLGTMFKVRSTVHKYNTGLLPDRMLVGPSLKSPVSCPFEHSAGLSSI
jgi:hypothetical protein